MSGVAGLVSMFEKAKNREIVPQEEVNGVVYGSIFTGWVPLSRVKQRIKDPDIRETQIKKALDQLVATGKLEVETRKTRQFYRREQENR